MEPDQMPTPPEGVTQVPNEMPPIPGVNAPEKKSFFSFLKVPKLNFKFILVSIIAGLLLGAAIYLRIQNKRLKSQLTAIPTPTPSTEPTATPSPTGEPTADWKTYNNQRLKFLFQYPQDYEFNVIPRDDGSGFTLMLGPNNDSLFRISARDKYSKPEALYFLDTPSTGKITINDKMWNIYYLPTGYGDGGTVGSGQPVYGLQLENNQILYTITMYNQKEINSQQNQILSTFEFTN